MEGVRKLIDAKATHNQLLTYVMINRHDLMNVTCSDIYSIIVTCIFKRDLFDFAKTNFAWHYVEMFYYEPNSYQVQKKDLEIERIDGLSSDMFYYKLLISFVQVNDVIDIPESFINYETTIKNKKSYVYHLRFEINKQFNVSDYKKFRNDKYDSQNNMISKLCQVLILYLSIYDILVIDLNKSYDVNKKHYFYSILDSLSRFLNGMELNDMENKNINESNIIEIYFDICHNVLDRFQSQEMLKYRNLNYNIAEYFEYMRLDEQVIFWNILLEIENKRPNFIFEILKASKSTVFIEYVIDNYEKLNTEDKIYDFMLDDIVTTCPFLFQKILQKYPLMRNNVIIYLFFVNIHLCFIVFPDLTNQELITLIKNKFL